MPPAAMRTSTSFGPSAGTSVSSSLRSRGAWMTTASDMTASLCGGLKAHRAAPQPALLRAHLPCRPGSRGTRPSGTHSAGAWAWVPALRSASAGTTRVGCSTMRRQIVLRPPPAWRLTMPGPSFDLSGRTALVTGGGSGLGLAMAEGLAAAGAAVVVVGRDKGKLEAGAKAIGAAGAEVCDLLDRAAIAPLVARVERAHGPVEILVNNAGIQHRAPIQDFPAEAWDRMIATHLSAPFFLAQAVAPGMIARRRGKIINTLSVTSELGRPTIIPYASAKGGLRMLTRGLAVELGPHNIQVNGIGPGYFTTEMNRALIDNPEFDAWVKKRTPAGRWGDPSELAGAAVFLASPAADYVTGQVIFVDGGFTASM